MPLQLYYLYSCFDCKSTKNLRAIHNGEIILEEDGKVVSTAKVQKIWEQFTTWRFHGLRFSLLFRLQKYKKFESNSQHLPLWHILLKSCFDCKSTKNLRAIHNGYSNEVFNYMVVSTAKVQKIWEQFTTNPNTWTITKSCFDCKSTKNLRAIHNTTSNRYLTRKVVSTAKVQKIWEQFTTGIGGFYALNLLFRLQKYKKFESNSQHMVLQGKGQAGCFDCKSTKNLRAIHNELMTLLYSSAVVSTAKVQKIWEQFTTSATELKEWFKLFRLQKYKKFESNSQRILSIRYASARCFDCKSTKNLRAIHNDNLNFF